ncbi:hypothetical protein FOA43_003457 [Brettanomyces nanus]|uniref:FAD dependent oxidoreductase domain-containing protein n=1 Tax=Eeniella nana TaxID=13502 RepID=A0A875S2Y7_EENNA|nr:uncharacterized protein FOA43_003457 [Brettanomyces nanus]QPG76071.1 hypothetical protein FOA43_003457 [Brettanomyces nanus]
MSLFPEEPKLDPETTRIVVVGCGVFGLSTILALTNKGYREIIGLDVSKVPSPRSAATDYNKMLRVEYANILYAKLSVEALRSWENDPLFKPYYKKVGRLVLSPYKEENKARLIYDKIGAENVKKLGVDQRIVELRSSSEIGRLIPGFKDNQLSNPLVARYKIDSALGESGKSLAGVYHECAKRGVKFIFGDGGHAIKIEEGKVIAKNGDVYLADKIIVSSGANTSALVDLNASVTAVGHFVSHVQLNDAQYDKYKKIPIFFSSEYGYFFPPDPKDHVIKIGHTFADARNFIKNPFNKAQTTSIPSYIHDAPTIVEEATKRLMNLVIPELAYNPVVNCTIGWTSLSYDENFIIDYATQSKSIIMCTGDSAHGYKFLPNIGKYIVKRMEGTLDHEHASAWRFRQATWSAMTVSERTERTSYDVRNVRHWIRGQPEPLPASAKL